MMCIPLCTYNDFQIPESEKKEVLKQLIESASNRKSVHVNEENFYKVNIGCWSLNVTA